MAINQYSTLVFNWVRKSVYSPIILTMMVTSILAIAITNDFGISTDESSDIAYGVESLRAFYSEPVWQRTLPAGPTGPFSFMLADVAARVFAFFNPVWMLTDGRHFTYFLMFQIAILSTYALCLRFTNPRAALLASFLFIAQPLLFGHAFINPKDIPFMAFFAASVAIGLAMVDEQVRSSEKPLEKDQGTEEKQGWTEMVRICRGMSLEQKARAFLISAISLSVVIEILVLNRFILPQMLSLIFNAYHNAAAEPVNSLFRFVAESADQFDVTTYLWKATQAYWILRSPSSIVILFTTSIFLRGKVQLPLRGLTSKVHLTLIFAGILLGLTTSIRIVAPFAGLLVSIYFLSKCGRKAFKSLAIYWGITAVISFITRPYFWDRPIERMWNSLISSSNFNFEGAFFFQGEIYSANNLPKSYSPVLILRQLTEPLLLLIFVGILVIAWKMLKGKVDRTLLMVIVGWAVVPIVLVSITKVLPYDNFRQFLFITIPLFIFASVGIEYISEKIQCRLAFGIIVLALLLPGILASVRLHPYEYIYYNSLVGDISDKDRDLEFDYWCTSHRAAMDYINDHAPDGSTIAVSAPINNAKPFAREDLILVDLDNELYVQDTDYVLLCTRYVNEAHFSQFETVWEVRRKTIPLAIVKRVE